MGLRGSDLWEQETLGFGDALLNHVSHPLFWMLLEQTGHAALRHPAAPLLRPSFFPPEPTQPV